MFAPLTAVYTFRIQVASKFIDFGYLSYYGQTLQDIAYTDMMTSLLSLEQHQKSLI